MSTLNGVEHSKVVQVNLVDPKQAPAEFNRDRAGISPLVVAARSGLTSPFVLLLLLPICRIPSGFHILQQSWYKHQKEEQPAGLEYCKPFWWRISHIASKQTHQLSAPATQVPTADNVMVDVNVSLTFSIPDFDSAVNFVYRLGTTRFDEFLLQGGGGGPVAWSTR